MVGDKKLRLRLIFYIALTAGILIVAFFGEKLSPYDPYKTDFYAIDQPPSLAHLCGTDNLGRDLLSRVMTGANSSLTAMLVIVAATAVIGTALGVAAGYYGGFLDVVIQRVLLIVQSFPGQVMALAVAGVLGAGLKNAMLALISIKWITYARMARSSILKIKSSGYIKAARLCGCGSGAIIVRHVLPNIWKVVFVTVMTALPGALIELSGLSFLGLSSQPPYPEWGYMMAEGRKVLMTQPWQALVPGLAILLTVIVLNRLGDTVEDCIGD